MEITKKHGVAVLIMTILVSFVSFYGLTSGEGEDGMEENDFFYSESDGRMIKKGPYWHPPGASNHYSVRYWGYKPPYDNRYPDIYVPVNSIETNQDLTFSFQMYNHENRELWFTIEDNGTSGDYVVDTENMGSVDGDAGKASWAYTITRENIPSVIDGGVIHERVELRISSWENSSYNVLYTRDNFKIDFHFIDRADDAWTVIDKDDFDDNTKEGWNVRGESGTPTVNSLTSRTFEARNTIYRSPNYALAAEVGAETEGYIEAVPYKTFSPSSSYSEAYFIATIRSEQYQDFEGDPTEVRLLENGTEVFYSPSVNTDTWYTFCLPIPTGENTEVSIDSLSEVTTSSTSWAYRTGWMDDVYVIAR